MGGGTVELMVKMASPPGMMNPRLGWTAADIPLHCGLPLGEFVGM